MTTELWLICAAIGVLIVCSAFFSGSETALTAASRARMHALEKDGDERAGMVNRLIETRDRLIGALLIGNNLVNILSSALATSLFLRLFGETGVIYATLAMTALLVIFAEVLPKSWAIASPDRFSMAVAPAVRAFVAVFGPLSWLVNGIVRRLLKLFGVNLASDASMLSAHEEIRGTVEVLHREGAFEKHDRDRMGGLLDLAELEVSDIMIHRTNMRSINGDDPPEQVVREVLESPYTRMPVWRSETDNIIGMIHAKDLLRALHEVDNDPSRIDIAKIASKPWFVPDTTTLQDQLNAFLRRKQHFAVVVDEYGGLAGLVAMEDLVETIVGDLRSPDERSDLPTLKRVDEKTFLADANLDVHDFCRAFELPEVETRIHTLGGLIAQELDRLPMTGDLVRILHARLTVTHMRNRRIMRVRISLDEPIADTPDLNVLLAQSESATPNGADDASAGRASS